MPPACRGDFEMPALDKGVDDSVDRFAPDAERCRQRVLIRPRRAVVAQIEIGTKQDADRRRERGKAAVFGDLFEPKEFSVGEDCSLALAARLAALCLGIRCGHRLHSLTAVAGVVLDVRVLPRTPDRTSIPDI